MGISPEKRACPVAWLVYAVSTSCAFFLGAGARARKYRRYGQMFGALQMNFSKCRRARLLSLHAVLVIHANGAVRGLGRREIL